MKQLDSQAITSPVEESPPAATAETPPPSKRKAAAFSPDKSHSNARRNHVDRVPMHAVMRWTLFSMWLIASASALSTSVVSDVFQGRGALFPLVPVLATSEGLNVVATIVVAILGKATVKGFLFYQPFAGGQAFVVMQAAGYTMATMAAVLKVAVLNFIPQTKNGLLSSAATTTTTTAVLPYGAFGVLGFFSALAQVILMSSLLFFVAPRKGRTQSSPTMPTWKRYALESPGREYILLSLCSFMVIVTSTIAEYAPAFQPVNVVVILTYTVLSTFVVTSVVAPVMVPYYSFLFFPFTSASTSLFMTGFHLFGNAQLFLAQVGIVVLYYAGVNAPPSWHLGCGLMATSGMSAHLLVLRFASRAGQLHSSRFVSSPTTNADEASAEDNADGNAVKSNGPMLATAVCLVLSSCIYAVAFFLSYDGVREEYVEKGLKHIQSLFIALLFTVPPITHLQGKLLFGTRYEIWKPFGGNTEFVLLQAFAWASYSFATFFTTLYIADISGGFYFLLLVTACLVLSQLLVHVSLQVFDEGHPLQAQSPMHTASSDNNVAELAFTAEQVQSHVAIVFNGEMLLAVVLSVVSLLLRAVCDTMEYSNIRNIEWMGSMDVPVGALSDAATVLSLLAVPVALVSMRDRVRQVLLAGPSSGFLVLLTAGLFMYLALGLTATVNLFTGSRHLIMCGKEYLFPQHTAQGLMFLVPFVCIVISSAVETENIMMWKGRVAKMQKASEDIKQMVLRLHGSDKDIRQVEQSLHALAWRHLPSDSASEGEGGERERKQVLTNAARSITSIASLACFTACITASFLAVKQPVITLVFGWASMLLLSLSCLSLHYVYGTRYHASCSEYSFFMPFKGGRRFTIWQGLGWCCYTVCACLMVACAVERRGTRLMFLTMSVMSVAAQICLYCSVPTFNAEKSATTLIRNNAEGLLAALTLLGTFSFARMYDMASAGRATTSASSLVPIAIVSISMCLAVPMGLLSLQRQAERFGVSLLSVLHEEHDIDSDEDMMSDNSPWLTPARANSALHSRSHSAIGQQGFSPPPSATLKGYRHRRMDSSFGGGSTTGSTPPLIRQSSSEQLLPGSRRRQRSRSYFFLMLSYCMSSMLAILVVLLVPFAGVFVVYSYVNDARTIYSAGASAMNWLVLTFGVLVTLPMLIAPLVQHSKMLRVVHSALCCWSIYSIPTYTVVGGLSPPLLVNTRGSWLFAINMLAMSVLSTIPYIHLLAFVFSVFSTGYFTQYHLYCCLYLRREPFILWQCVCDLLSALFWLWYVRRYAGRPEMTGRFESRRATRFFQKYVFEGVSYYFSTRILSAPEAVLPCEAEAGVERHKPADLSVAENQYIFSFHPHGVFPGTSIYATKTLQWERVVGQNSKHFISVHCADVVFSVPMMREFPMCLGAMSVTRRGIENSIKAGNSPMIITGGQSEMLLTRMSNTEMHLVCHHEGFIRVAMRNKLPLVPVLSFTECNVLDNVHILPLQRWALKRFGFPFPVMPRGVLNLPLPMRTPITIVVGPPLSPLPGRDDPDDKACVEEMKMRYFEHLEVLFYRYRKEAGYPQMKLYLHNGIDHEGVMAEPPAAGVDEKEHLVRGPSAVFRAVYGEQGDEEEEEEEGDGNNSKKTN